MVTRRPNQCQAATRRRGPGVAPHARRFLAIEHDVNLKPYNSFGLPAVATTLVLFWRLDRLARSLPHLIELAADFEKRGIQLRSLTENIDTSTAAGKLFFNIFASIAEFERNLIIERTHAGLDAARAQGKFGGRPLALDKRKMKLIDAAVRDAHRDGRQPSAKEIAFSIGTSERTVRRYIRGEYNRNDTKKAA